MLFYDLQSNGNPETRFFLHQKTKCFKCKAIIILRWIPVKRRQDYLFKRKFLFKKARKGNAKSFVGTCPLSLTDTCTFWMLRTPVLLYEKNISFIKCNFRKKYSLSYISESLFRHMAAKYASDLILYIIFW